MKRYGLILLFIFIYCSAKSQSNVVGSIVAAPDSTVFSDCHVTLIQNDSILRMLTPEIDGSFFIGHVKHGEYTIVVDALGYEDYIAKFNVEDYTLLEIVLQPRAVTQLNEVVVTADRSETITRTANGQIFYLSPEAKQKHNPFMALQEIPLLLSDPNTSSVSLINGDTPLVLINGKRVNSGIAPISPDEIESVEVITNPSARYLKDGVKAIVNIKLKRKEQPYLWFELATRHDIPLDYGFGVGYFEIGNPKYSLYGRISPDYTYHDDYVSEVTRSDVGYVQNYSNRKRHDSWRWLGELLFKANPTPSNYFAAHLYAHTKTSKDKLHGDGDMTVADVTTPYTYTGNNRDESTVVTASAYYSHTFYNKSELEARLAYNFNRNDYTNSRVDEYSTEPPTSTRYERVFHNRRHSGQFQLDYSNNYSDYNSLTAGAHTSFQSDRIEHVLQPYSYFRHREVSQYFYAGWVNKFWEKVWLVASAGVEGIWLKADEYSNHYFRPRVSVGISWPINGHNSVSLDYQLTNTAPEVGQLNPYNTSTDMMVEYVGNPYLMPQTMHYIPLSYTYNIKGWYISPNVYYKRITDMLSPTGYTKDDGVFVSTYENHGHFTQLMAYLNVSYRLMHGRVFVLGGWYANYYTGQPRHNSFLIQSGFNYTLDKFSFYGQFAYQNQHVNSDIQWTRYYKPTTAELQVNYNFTPDFYIGVCLQHFTGKFHGRTTTETGTYRQVVDARYLDQNLRPWIILRYTFRKNASRKIKLGKVLESHEKGISL